MCVYMNKIVDCLLETTWKRGTKMQLYSFPCKQSLQRISMTSQHVSMTSPLYKPWLLWCILQIYEPSPRLSEVCH